MVRKTMKMLLVALIAAFALSSMAEAAAPPKKAVRHRAKHSSRVASGGSAPVANSNGTASKPPAKKKAPAAKSGTRARTSPNASAPKPPAKKAPAKRRPTTKPR